MTDDRPQQDDDEADNRGAALAKMVIEKCKADLASGWRPENTDDDEAPSDYLRDLAERLRGVPVMYGVNGEDIDTLEAIATDIDDGRLG